MLIDFMWFAFDWARPYLGPILVGGAVGYVTGRVSGGHARRRSARLRREEQP